MSDLHNIYLELHQELIKNLVVYIPTNLIENNSIVEIISELKTLHGIELNLENKDKLLLFDSSFNLIVSPELNSLLPFYSKSINLQKNSYKFLELCQTLSDDSFDFIYLNYLEKLKDYINASEILSNEIETICPKNIVSKKNIFIQQNEIFKNHLVELEFTIGFTMDSSDEINNQFDIENKKNIIFFSSYILHKDCIAIEKIIVERFHNRNPRNIRYLIECLAEINFITLEHGKGKLIIEALNNSFGHQNLAYKSIFGYKIDKVNNANYKSIKIEVYKSLNEFV
jgi:hypothetical protein